MATQITITLNDDETRGLKAMAEIQNLSPESTAAQIIHLELIERGFIRTVDAQVNESQGKNFIRLDERKK